MILMFCFVQSNAQIMGPAAQAGNLRQRLITITDHKGLWLDSLSIVPYTFQMKGIDSSAYRIDYVNAILYWVTDPISLLQKKDTGISVSTNSDTLINQQPNVFISYRVFPMRLNAVAQRRDFDSLLMYSAAPTPIQPPAANRNPFNFGNINAQGSFGRQIGFGNSQSAVLNSNMNILLSGFLADSIELQAAITDNNIPVQPDGNTQHLNEFDEVYIRFKKRNWQLNIGDLDVREDKSHFLKFYKRLQGISFHTANQVSKNVQSNTLVSGSIAKGKFTRNVINGLEGNQGPYRLRGANNETFFIVLANTERVYIDGTLLQRGEDQDYVINYNTAEVSFTPRRMITKDSRIQIEFEYADRNYLNTNIFATQEVDFNKKLILHIGYFNNSDAKNSAINQVLDNRQKQFLYELGDSTQKAFYRKFYTKKFILLKVMWLLIPFTAILQRHKKLSIASVLRKSVLTAAIMCPMRILPTEKFLSMWPRRGV